MDRRLEEHLLQAVHDGEQEGRLLFDGVVDRGAGETRAPAQLAMLFCRCCQAVAVSIVCVCVCSCR